MELSSAPASAVALLLEQRFGAVGNSFCNFVDSEDLSPLVRRSRSCPNLLLFAAEQPPAMPRKEVTAKQKDTCRRDCLEARSYESFSTQYTETDLESASDNEISSPYTSESSCMLSMRRYETLEVSMRDQWEVSSELDEDVEPPMPIQAARHQGAKRQQQPQMTEEAGTAATTLMIQSLPTNLSQRDLVKALHVLGMDFDFLYMPSNFRTGAPHGYAFVNLTSAAAAAQLKALWGGRRPWGGAGRPLTVLPADVQGLEANAKKWDTAKMRRVRNPEHRPLVRANRQIARR